MPRNYLTVYSFQDVVVSIDGVPVENLWEGDDAVEIADMNDFAEAMEGVDGAVIHSMGAGDAKTVTLRLMHTSAAHKLLQKLTRLMRDGFTVPFALSIRGTRSGEGGSAPTALILTRPGRSYGRTASEREWTIVASPWSDFDISYTTT